MRDSLVDIIFLKLIYLYPLSFSDKPYNPLLNSGGIMSVALILKEVRPDLGTVYILRQ